ncbi:MAG: DNA N-6-adenine-methyltransferase, partial [Vulcanimicrobiaceae bacterium]
MRNAYKTPKWLVERISRLLGGIELHPCTSADNPCVAATFYAPDDDGILTPWNASRIYMNPPYGNPIKLWARKALDAALSGVCVLILVPARTDSRWFQEALRFADGALLVAGRLRFVGTSEGGE